MQLRDTKLAWAAAGIFAVGTAAGWSTPRLIKTLDAPTRTTEGVATQTSIPTQPIPPATAPNYREIVARNRSAVVGISSVEEVKAASTPFQLRVHSSGTRLKTKTRSFDSSVIYRDLQRRCRCALRARASL